jgi:hypothetical protein
VIGCFYTFLSVGEGGGNSVQEMSTNMLLVEFELLENRHNESYNFREGVHEIFSPYFLHFSSDFVKKISTGDLFNIIYIYRVF